MRYFPVSKPVKHEDGTVDPAPESSKSRVTQKKKALCQSVCVKILN